MFTVYVGMEGFMVDGGFTVKEMTMLYEPGTEFDHFLFSPPVGALNAVDQKTVNWTTRNLHRLHWTEGLVPYETLHGILDSISNCIIVCHGHTTANYLAKMLPNALVQDTSKKFKLPREIPMAGCGRCHGGRHCSLAKAKYIRENFMAQE